MDQFCLGLCGDPDRELMSRGKGPAKESDEICWRRTTTTEVSGVRGTCQLLSARWAGPRQDACCQELKWADRDLQLDGDSSC